MHISYWLFKTTESAKVALALLSLVPCKHCKGTASQDTIQMIQLNGNALG